jgi:hypothetical protein
MISMWILSMEWFDLHERPAEERDDDHRHP